MSPYFITDAEEMKCEMTNPYILCYKGKLNSLSEILFSLETAVQQGRPVLLIVDDIDSMALETLVMNKVKNQLNLCVIKSPFDSEYFSNLCVMIGADPKEHSMGSADKVIVTSDASSITGFPPGTYETLSNLAVLTPEGKLYNPEKQCLVGSASTMTMCMNFLESLEFLSEEELRKVGRDNALKLLGML
jgi:chaperonin GroEL (HSP60 family)